MADIMIIVLWVAVPVVAACAALQLFVSFGGSESTGESAWTDFVDHDEFQRVERSPDRETSRRAIRSVRLASDPLALRRTHASGSGPDGDGAEIPAASAAIGRPILRDDLTALDGIGTKTAQVLEERDIVTWRRLAETSTVELHAIFDDSGRRLHPQMLEAWPVQARLLDEGRWYDFVEFVDEVEARLLT